MTQQSVHQLYKRLETIGKGAYGSVHKGLHIPSGNVVALKIIDLDTADDDVEDIQREVALLTQLRDAPNVTKYFGCHLDGPRVWIIMEYAQGGSVRDLMNISRDGTLEERYVVVVVREVLQGLSYLHKSSIIHRDIKAANVLITATGKVMICDFGVSALLATAGSKRNTLMGTPNWMAPEVAQTVPAYDTRADIWSLGIMIYEMVKGSPPHVGIDKFKVIHLIPRVAPPRLNEGEGSKDMRDFVSFCLKESPNDRLSADELARTKWIKSAGKVTILKDLLLRYEAWKKGGGSRDSLAAPLPWEEEEERDLQDFGHEEHNPWEFDTVRGRPVHIPTDDDPDDDSGTPPDDSFIANTIRPSNPAKLPSSLRHLFQEDSVPQLDTSRPTLGVPTTRNTPSPTPSPTRERAPLRRHATVDGTDDALTAKQANFAFPPRPGAMRSKPKAPSSTHGSEDEETRKERLPPLGAGIPRRPPPASSARDPGEESSSSLTVNGRGSYREVRSTRGVHNIEIPPAPTPDVDVDVAQSVTSPEPQPESSSDALPSTPSSSRPQVHRSRSQSSASGLSTYSALDFHFPSPTAQTHSPIFGLTSRTHNRISPTHLSASGVLSPNNHQTAIADVLPSPRPQRPPPTGPLPLPPSLSRSHSANPIAEHPAASSSSSGPAESLQLPSRRSSVTRNTSVSVMESIQQPPLVPPVRPFARTGRDRNGSQAQSDGSISSQSLGLPGLKDVLKVPSLTSEHQLGMTDLLPPSPVPSMYGTRTFAPSPSLLGPPSTQGESSQSSRNNSSSPLRTGSPDNMTSADMSLSTANSYSYSANGSSFATTSPNTSFGPTTRPLDYTAILVSHEATHIELARTVDDLTQWLSVVEVGLTGMLEKAFEDTIEEEQEGLPEASVSLDVDHEPPGENSLHDTSIAISNDPILAPAARP